MILYYNQWLSFWMIKQVYSTHDKRYKSSGQFNDFKLSVIGEIFNLYEECKIYVILCHEE